MRCDSSQALDEGRMMRREITKGYDHTFRIPTIVDAFRVSATLGKVRITRPGDTSEGEDETVYVIGTEDEGVDAVIAEGEIAYTFTASDNDTLGKNFIFTCDYTINDVTNSYRHVFDVLAHAIAPTIHDGDIIRHLGSLAVMSADKKVFVRAEGMIGAFTTADLWYDLENYEGAGIEIVYKGDSGRYTHVHKARITGITRNDVTSDVTCVFYPEMTVAVPAGSVVTLRKTYAAIIEKAFDAVMSDLRGEIAGEVSNYIDTTILNRLTLLKAVKMIALANTRENNDVWSMLDEVTESDYEKEMANAKKAVR